MDELMGGNGIEDDDGQINLWLNTYQTVLKPTLVQIKEQTERESSGPNKTRGESSAAFEG